MKWLFVSILINWLYLRLCKKPNETYDQLLKKYLLSDYNPTSFPSNKPMKVEITLALIGIV